MAVKKSKTGFGLVVYSVHLQQFCNIAHSEILEGNRFIVRCHLTSK